MILCILTNRIFKLSSNIGLPIKNSGFDVAVIDLRVEGTVSKFITIGSIGSISRI